MAGLTALLLLDMIVAAEQPAAKPAWIESAPHLQGTVYQTVVKSGLFVTQAECEQAVEPKLRSAVAQYLDDYLVPGASARVTIDAELLGKLQKDRYLETAQSATVGPMQQLYVLLEFDDAARSDLTRRWHQAIVNTRLAKLAAGSATILGLMAMAVGYLKWSLRSVNGKRAPSG